MINSIIDARFQLIIKNAKVLETAIFYNFSAGFVRYPAEIIVLSGINEKGALLFDISRPFYSEGGEADVAFPAQLRFYKKNAEYWLYADGSASVETANPGAERVTIIFKIEHAELIALVAQPSLKRKWLQYFIYFLFSFYKDDKSYSNVKGAFTNVQLT
ncbi:MAG TPA: hypothetical protein VHB48_02525 [Chitinophagaceae bacterium]|nr:hypothetical protein [Chitinophagaceae bacterium]